MTGSTSFEEALPSRRCWCVKRTIPEPLCGSAGSMLLLRTFRCAEQWFLGENLLGWLCGSTWWVVVAMGVVGCAAAVPRLRRAWSLDARVGAGLRLAPRVGSAGCGWARRRWCSRFVMTSIFCCAQPPVVTAVFSAGAWLVLCYVRVSCAKLASRAWYDDFRMSCGVRQFGLVIQFCILWL